MSPSLFIITAQTNLHPGSGDANYGIIDKLVQRDPISDLPVIHASSLKGAILQHLNPQEEMTDEYIDEVFGRQVEKRWKAKRTVDGGQTGKFVFMQANLLSIPIRSDVRAFFRVSGSQVLAELRQHLIEVQCLEETDPLAKALETVAKESNTRNKAIFLEDVLQGQKIHLEDLKNVDCMKSQADAAGLAKLKDLLGGDGVVVLHNSDLSHLADNHHLPVIARNHLENGQSTNLWYEQVLPRQTRFAFTLLRPDTLTHATDFDDRLTEKGLVQIGANASVGYGYCKIENFKTA